MNEKQPEMFSLALSNGNKVTIGFRDLPITEQDLNRIYQFLGLLAEAISGSSIAHKEPEMPPVPMANAGRVFHGHFPTDASLATASERIALRENIRWATAAMEESRLQELHAKKQSETSSDESESGSQNS